MTSASNESYVTITADTHAGASIDAYRAYLEPKDRAAFDEWRGGYRNPSKKHIGGKKTKNWHSAERRKDLRADGVAGELILQLRVEIPADSTCTTFMRARAERAMKAAPR